MDTDAVRTFVAVADTGQFQHAADELSITRPARQVQDGVAAVRVLDEPVQLLTGPGHQLAAARVVTPGQLAGHRIWIPGLVAGTEWAAFYDELAAAFGLAIERPT